MRPQKFERLAVIAASDVGSRQQMAARVREQLSDAVEIVQAGGLYADETDAVASICREEPGGAPPPDGVIFVDWNRLTLRDCDTRRVAYEVQGGYEGTDEMVRRLERYLERAPDGSGG